MATEEERLTYAQVLDRAVRWDLHLRERGVRPGERVMVALPDGPD